VSVPAGRLIVFEGIDGSGKSTQAELLAGALGAELTHEPGATVLGQALRRMLLGEDASTRSAQPVPVARAEALLMAADRAQHVTEIVRPALAAGRWVVSDRFSASTLAYQGYGQGLPADVLGQLVAWAADGLVPDLTVLVDVSLEVAQARLTASPDRLERMDEGFFARVRSGYLQMAAEDRQGWAVVDGSAPVVAVAAAVAAAVRDRLGDPPAPASAPRNLRS
jgi:dTMP kinase